MVEIMNGNLIVIAGVPNTGKTALVLNILRYNMKKWGVHYFNSEMGASELKKRLELFDDATLPDWENLNAYERSDNFGDVVVSGKGNLNVIDFLEIHDNFYEVGGKLNDIYRKLKGAIGIVCLQKNAGVDTGLGGMRSLEKPRLYLAVDYGKVKIVKAKNWKGHENPNRKQCEFKIVKGCNLIMTSQWKEV